MVEIEEETTATGDETTPLLSNPDSTQQPEPSSQTGSVKTKVPEVTINLYRRGKGPIDVIKCPLGGWEQDQLDVRQILDTYGFKSIFAFNPNSGRGVPIRFNPRNGRSILTYTDGGVVNIDGEPKDSLIKPVTKILIGVTSMTILIVLAMKETPTWAKKLNLSGFRVPPWVLACVVIVFTRMRKRTKDFLEKRLR